MASTPVFSKDSSILVTILRNLGNYDTCDAFDAVVTTYINSNFMKLYQLGIGSLPVYQITGRDETWADFLGNDFEYYADVVQFLYLSVKLVFDPPASSVILESLKNILSETESRLNTQYECNISNQ